MAALINQKESIVEGLKFVQEMINGSMTVLVMTDKGVYCSRDRLGRTPVILGKKEGAYCASFESFAYLNLGYDHLEGPGACGDRLHDSGRRRDRQRAGRRGEDLFLPCGFTMAIPHPPMKG